MKKKRTPTFAEITASVLRESEAEARRRRIRDARPGGFGLDGRLYDPSGTPLEISDSTVTPADAAALVRAGARLAFESCGCGGGGGCLISWYDGADVAGVTSASIPEFVKAHGAPTWIDLWEGEGTRVVFAHGDVRWGSILI